MKYEIYKGDPTQIDSIGFQNRLEGKEVRDCLLILKPEEKCLSGLVVRGEIGGTVHECVVRNGLGVLDIDASRIRSGKDYENAGFGPRYGESAMPQMGRHQTRDWVQERIASGEPVKVTEPHAGGRFPANLILKHGEKCKCVGTKLKEIKGSGKVTGGSGYQLGGYDHGQKDKRPSFEGYAKDGKEEVADWECEEGCPVRELDLQSGLLKSGAVADHHMRNNTQNPAKGGYSGGLKDMPLMGYGDEGGASRFFKQVQSEKELEEYLNTLIRGS